MSRLLDEREAQGLPRYVTDPDVLIHIAGIFRSALQAQAQKVPQRPARAARKPAGASRAPGHPDSSSATRAGVSDRRGVRDE